MANVKIDRVCVDYDGLKKYLKDHGMSVKKLAKFVGRSDSMIYKYLKIGEMPIPLWNDICNVFQDKELYHSYTYISQNIKDRIAEIKKLYALDRMYHLADPANTPSLYYFLSSTRPLEKSEIEFLKQWHHDILNALRFNVGSYGRLRKAQGAEISMIVEEIRGIVGKDERIMEEANVRGLSRDCVFPFYEKKEEP